MNDLKEHDELQGVEPGHDHTEVVRQVSTQLPEDDILYDLADLFRIFADSTRYSLSFPHLETILGRS